MSREDKLIAEIKSYATDPHKQETLSDLTDTYGVTRLADLSEDQLEKYLEHLKEEAK